MWRGKHGDERLFLCASIATLLLYMWGAYRVLLRSFGMGRLLGSSGVGKFFGTQQILYPTTADYKDYKVIGYRQGSNVKDRSVRIFMYDIPEELLYGGSDPLTMESCPMTGIYGAELFIPASLPHAPFYVKDQFHHKELSQTEREQSAEAEYYLVPHYSTCIYHQCLRGWSKNDGEAYQTSGEYCHRVAARYLKRIVDHIEKKYPFWHRYNGADHLLIFTWDGGADLIGRDTHLRTRIADSIHLTHLGSANRTENFRPFQDITIPPFRDYRWVIQLRQREALHETYAKGSKENNLLEARPIYAYFRGTIRSEWLYSLGIRQQLPLLAESMPHRYFIKTGHSDFYWSEVVKARFLLCPAGWEPWSPRLFDGIVGGAIPVLLTDKWILPFEAELPDILSYDSFIIRTSIDQLDATLSNLSLETEQAMRTKLDQVRHRFIYNFVPQPEDALGTIIELLGRRITSKEKRALLSSVLDLEGIDEGEDMYDESIIDKELNQNLQKDLNQGLNGDVDEDLNEDDDGQMPIGRVEL